MPHAVTRRSAQPKRAPKRHNLRSFFVVIIVLAVFVAAGSYAYAHRNKTTTTPSTHPSTTQSSTSPTTSSKTTPATPAATACSSNTLSQLILVSISQQHMWACQGNTQLYDNPVVTGMELYPADLTPPGTYKIYAKYTDQTLKGCDGTGCWSDPVSYWMPFLDNQYGQYGFHDATWRTPGQFGTVNINAPYTASVHGSHGCVEMPLSAAKWLYDWASVGTTVTVES